ncbi:MAG: head GIN domain-containing protein, partial [Bacteroidota bacterium]
ISSGYSRMDSDKFFSTPFDFSSDAYVRTHDIADFSKISSSAGIFVEIRQGNGYDFQVVAEDKEDLEEFRFEVKNERLTVYFDKKDWNWNFFSKDSWNWGGDVPKVQCIITVPDLKHLELSSASQVNLYGLKGDKLNVDISSAAKLIADINYNHLNMDVSSASKVKIRGNADNMDLDISSAAKMEGFDLIARNADIDASSASKAEVHVTGFLDASASSAAKINYQGRPRLESSSSSGAKVSAD